VTATQQRRAVTDAELEQAPDLTQLGDLPAEARVVDVSTPTEAATLVVEPQPAEPATQPAAQSTAETFAPAPLPAPGPVERPVDPLATALAEALADGIWTADATAPRSLQTALGFSQLGGECDRRLMYHLRGTQPINHPDPLRAIVGTGVHLILANFFRRLDAGTGRYLVEQELLWQGVPGTVDLYDRRRKTVIDWKTTLLEKLARYRSQGPTYTQVVQVMGYGAALQAAGEAVESVALAFIPTDGTLNDIYVWRAPLDITIAQRAIERLAGVAQQPFPATASPSALCRWCPFHRPGSTNLSLSCPGKE
jgi:PD-(D/E)XK nuclease superfamily